MIIFKVGYNGGITQEECQRETKDFYVFSDKSKTAKRSGWVNYFPSWEEAKQFIVDQREQELASAKRKVDICRSHLETAKALKPKDSP